jgi:hypothetical protein
LLGQRRRRQTGGYRGSILDNVAVPLQAQSSLPAEEVYVTLPERVSRTDLPSLNRIFVMEVARWYEVLRDRPLAPTVKPLSRGRRVAFTPSWRGA